MSRRLSGFGGAEGNATLLNRHGAIFDADAGAGASILEVKREVKISGVEQACTYKARWATDYLRASRKFDGFHY